MGKIFRTVSTMIFALVLHGAVPAHGADTMSSFDLTRIGPLSKRDPEEPWQQSPSEWLADEEELSRPARVSRGEHGKPPIRKKKKTAEGKAVDGRRAQGRSVAKRGVRIRRNLRGRGVWVNAPKKHERKRATNGRKTTGRSVAGRGARIWQNLSEIRRGRDVQAQAPKKLERKGATNGRETTGRPVAGRGARIRQNLSEIRRGRDVQAQAPKKLERKGATNGRETTGRPVAGRGVQAEVPESVSSSVTVRTPPPPASEPVSVPASAGPTPPALARSNWRTFFPATQFQPLASKPKGIGNSNRSCFANSVIQLVYGIKEWRDVILQARSDPNSVTSYVQKIFNVLGASQPMNRQSNNEIQTLKSSIYGKLNIGRNRSNQFVVNEGNYADDFLRAFLAGIDGQLRGPMGQLLGFNYRDAKFEKDDPRRCVSCLNISGTILSLLVGDNSRVTLQQKIESFCETKDDDEYVDTNGRRIKVFGHKKFSNTGQFFIIQVDRDFMDTSICVDISDELNFKPAMMGDNRPIKGKLVGWINHHIGRSGYAHYIAFSPKEGNGGDFWKIDDTKVESVSSENMAEERKEACILVYKLSPSVEISAANETESPEPPTSPTPTPPTSPTPTPPESPESPTPTPPESPESPTPTPPRSTPPASAGSTPKGMINGGSACFFNSAIQLTYGIEELRNAISLIRSNDDDSLINYVQAIFGILGSSGLMDEECDQAIKKSRDSIFKILNRETNVEGNQFAASQSCDVTEFLNAFFAKINQEHGQCINKLLCYEVYDKMWERFKPDNFSSNPTNPGVMLDLPFNPKEIANKRATQERMTRDLYKEEDLSGISTVNNGLVNASKRVTIGDTNQLLVVRANRHSNDKSTNEEGTVSSQIVKIDTPIDVLDEWLSPPRMMGKNELVKAKLVGWINHYGKQFEYGHYKAFVKNEGSGGGFWEFDDKKVKLIDQENDIRREKENAYILVYKLEPFDWKPMLGPLSIEEKHFTEAQISAFLSVLLRPFKVDTSVEGRPINNNKSSLPNEDFFSDELKDLWLLLNRQGLTLLTPREIVKEFLEDGRIFVEIVACCDQNSGEVFENIKNFVLLSIQEYIYAHYSKASDELDRLGIDEDFIGLNQVWIKFLAGGREHTNLRCFCDDIEIANPDEFRKIYMDCFPDLLFGLDESNRENMRRMWDAMREKCPYAWDNNKLMRLLNFVHMIYKSKYSFSSDGRQVVRKSTSAFEKSECEFECHMMCYVAKSLLGFELNFLINMLLTFLDGHYRNDQNYIAWRSQF
ncbi:MAG: ubiquitin carboxyl-terminal hydrolase [Puniceicoccales bacterium]|nr:ubiquitin carboxyl-terminal hydrolase [Puniceicoccales bacterium]